MNRVCWLAFFLAFSTQFSEGQTPSPAPKLTEASEYLNVVQRHTLRYFWNGAHPISGLAPERTATPNIVTSGGSGMGIMAIVAGVHRGWIPRANAVQRLLKMTAFLGKAERFHGAWSHWLDGKTGQVVPFGANDNGGDLVETAFLVNGLLVARQYFNGPDPAEKSLRTAITKLWESVEWDWYASRGDGKLYWHWSADKGWAMNMPITGYNECLITYVMALGSPTHAIKPEVYQTTWKKSSKHFLNGKKYLGYTVPVGFDYVGPLFFAHYSYLSLDPRRMQDETVNYWHLNLTQTLLNYKHCVEKAPKDYGYAPDNWGLTASDDYNFYDAHNPANDNGTISPTAALSSFPYTPYYAWRALRGFYLRKGNRLFGEYGFYDAFNETKNWYSNQFLAIDQGPIVVMMENYRSGLIWKLGEKIPELQTGLAKMDISVPEYPTGFATYLPDPDKPVVALFKHPDYDQYQLEITVTGTAPVSLDLQTPAGKPVLELFKNKAVTENVSRVPFTVPAGSYRVLLRQGSAKHTLQVELH